MGSSDSFFFHQAYLKGGKIVWVDEARVKEILPQNRVDVGWIIQRSFRMGVTDFEMKKQLGAYFSTFNSLLMYILYLFLFAILSMLTLPFNRGISLKLFLQMAKAAGFLYKMAGFTYLEYKTIE
jgi:succinoglycan biosynthesis protein ExoM